MNSDPAPHRAPIPLGQPLTSKVVILCVDDEPTVLESLKIELRRSLNPGYLIETAEGGREALELVEELQRDNYTLAVVLADYIMPDMRGDQLLSEVHQRSPQTLNIMISGQADLDAVGRSIQYAKLYRYISKPWQREDLTLTLTEALNSFLQSRELEQQTEARNVLAQQLQRLNASLEQQVLERTAELEASMQALRELSQLKDDFLHAVSHDLRTPVAGMLLVLKRLQNQPKDPLELSQSVLSRMIQGAQQQLQMIESLLEVHFDDVQGTALRVQPTEIGELVAAIVPLLEPLVQEEQGQLLNQIPPHLALLAVDPSQIRRVFENLITNALKHNPPGVEICLTAHSDPTQIRLEVQDNGLGISQAECTSLFERYSQGGTRARRSVGVGLGLYLCRKIITAHGGEIGALSHGPGQGTTFWFTLPRELTASVPAL
jgi:two-component system, sensor histidine kinase and response regulator